MLIFIIFNSIFSTAESKPSEKDIFKVPFILVIVLLLVLLLVLGVVMIYRRRVQQNDIPHTADKSDCHPRGSCTIAQTEHEIEQRDITPARV